MDASAAQRAKALGYLLRYAEGAPQARYGDTRERSGAILERVFRVKDTSRLEAELRVADALYPSASRQEKTALSDVTHALRKVIAPRRDHPAANAPMGTEERGR